MIRDGSLPVLIVQRGSCAACQRDRYLRRTASGRYLCAGCYRQERKG